MIKRIIFSFFVLILLVGLFFFITANITRYTGLFVSDSALDKEKDFTNCLESKDLTVYINTQDTSGTLKNLLVKDYLPQVSIVNCAWDNERCLNVQITSFPSWIIEGKIISRDVSIDELSRMSNCRRV